MFDMTIRQALTLYHQLELAFNGKNTYAGDTAEIYGYQCTEWPPLMQGNFTDGILLLEQRKIGTRAGDNLNEIIALFYKDHDAEISKILVDDSILVVRKGIDPIYHRVHVKIVRQKTQRRECSQ